jgi:hypothetical protein
VEDTRRVRLERHSITSFQNKNKGKIIPRVKGLSKWWCWSDDQGAWSGALARVENKVGELLVLFSSFTAVRIQIQNHNYISWVSHMSEMWSNTNDISWRILLCESPHIHVCSDLIPVSPIPRPSRGMPQLPTINATRKQTPSDCSPLRNPNIPTSFRLQRGLLELPLCCSSSWVFLWFIDTRHFTYVQILEGIIITRECFSVRMVKWMNWWIGEEGIPDLGLPMGTGVREGAGCGIVERVILPDSDRGMVEGTGEVKMIRHKTHKSKWSVNSGRSCTMTDRIRM